jgi:hypothetical protein
MKNGLRIFLLVITLAGSAASQGFWEKKDFHQWSEADCQKLLTESPWAQAYTFKRVVIAPLQQPETPTMEPLPFINYQVTVLSALPVRQALVRASQITARYDKLSVEQQKAFDQKSEMFLSGNYADKVVFRVSYNSNVVDDDRRLAIYWRSQTKETLKNTIYLIRPDGQKLPLLNYTVASGSAREFELIFPRQYEGHPVVTAQDTEFRLEFVHPTIRTDAERRILINFKVKKMVVRNELLF